MPSDESKGSQLDAIGSLAQRQLDNTVAVERQPVVRPAGELADVAAPDGQAGRRLPVWLPAGAQFEGTARQAVPEHPSAHGGQRADARAADATVRPNDASDISTAVARDAGSSRIGAVASLRLRLPPPCASVYRGDRPQPPTRPRPATDSVAIASVAIKVTSVGG